MGIDRFQIDSSAKADIGIIGEENWLGRRLEKLEEFKKQLEKAEEMIKKAKANLKKKQA